jgi:hypothetical protein
VLDKLKAFFQTSEGWGALFAGILGVFVSAGILTPEMAKTAVDILVALITVILLRVAKKTATPGEVPFQPVAK